MTHNIMEYHKYEKDGTPKKAFPGKGTQCTSCCRDATCGHNTVYMQLSARIAKLEISNRKLKHASNKCKHKCDSDSNYSESS
jgi:hypothetical protein